MFRTNRIIAPALFLTIIVGCSFAPPQTQSTLTPPPPQLQGYRTRAAAQSTGQFTSSEEAKIPYSEVIHYPSNWPEISARRDQQNGR